MANLHLLQSAGHVSGQIRTQDLSSVDIGVSVSKVTRSERSTVDSPPAKAAPRYNQLLRGVVMIRLATKD